MNPRLSALSAELSSLPQPETDDATAAPPHRHTSEINFDHRRQQAELDYVPTSPAAMTSLAENYVGLRQDRPSSFVVCPGLWTFGKSPRRIISHSHAHPAAAG